MYFVIINDTVKIAMNYKDYRERGDELVYYDLSAADMELYRQMKKVGYSDRRIYKKLSPRYEIRSSEPGYRRSNRLSKLAKKIFRR